MADRDEVLARLGDAQIAAQNAIVALSDQMDAEPNPGRKEAIRRKIVAANSLYQKATNALEHEEFNPDGSALPGLETATAKLEQRIERFKEDRRRLDELSGALNLLSSAISFLLVLA